MNYRTGFISNSSSCSFIISKKNLDKEQIEKIYHHKKWGKKLGICNDMDNSWDIINRKSYLSLCTPMDNFDMLHFLFKINYEGEIIWINYPHRDKPPKFISQTDHELVKRYGNK